MAGYIYFGDTLDNERSLTKRSYTRYVQSQEIDWSGKTEHVDES